ncbi:MAG: hypothetical protein K2P81_07780 [Bacteriovoracaceae bacterium]|nr:hypothetical protein [Bacteriovoracaceae bacterium]
MRFTLLLVLLCSTAMAQNLSTSFPAGAGAAYKLKTKGNSTPVALSIYVAGTRVDSVNIEYFMEVQGIVPVQMWQQFEIGVASKGAEIRSGYVQTKELKTPEIMPKEYLQGAAGGIQMNDFLFAKKEHLDKFKVGEETVEIAAGTTKATHYKTSNNGQTVDYWISDEAKPFGLVMLISKGDKPQQNYGIELTHIISNVKAKIQPERTTPLSTEGKSLLAKPESLR